MLTTRKLALDGVVELLPRKLGDTRGYFAETFRTETMVEHGLPSTWIQDNQSLSAEPLTLRGLHYQEPPFAQDKLVRVLRGRVLDAVVDIREGSPTFGRWLSLELSAQAFNQILVPAGFAHGFLTLEPDTEVFYKVSAPYSAAHDRGISWNDPDIAIEWPLGGREPVLSAKDRAAPRLSESRTPFTIGSRRTT